MKIRFFYIDAGVHPVRGQVFYWQKEAIGGKDARRYNQYLCEVLGAVAQCPDDCNRLLRYINDVETGTQDTIEAGGNDVKLTLKTTGVQVDIEINEDWIGQPDGKFELREWKAALEGWREFLKLPESLNSVVEIEL